MYVLCSNCGNVHEDYERIMVDELVLCFSGPGVPVTLTELRESTGRPAEAYEAFKDTLNSALGE